MDEISLLPEHWEEVPDPPAFEAAPAPPPPAAPSAPPSPAPPEVGGWLPPTVQAAQEMSQEMQWAISVADPLPFGAVPPPVLGGVAARGTGTIVLTRPAVLPAGGPPTGAPSPVPVHGRHRRKKPHWITTTWLRRTLKIFLALVLLVALLLGGAVGYVYYRYSQVKKVTIPAIVPVNPAIDPGENIILVGSDVLPPPGGAGAGGSPVNASAASHVNVIMVFHLNLANGTASVLSIPPQLDVEISGVTETMDTVFGRGPAALVGTVTQVFGIPINHYVGVDDAGIESMVNEVGGVKLRFDYPVQDPYSGLSISHSGCSSLNGSQALALVRSVDYQYESGFTWITDTTSSFGVAQRQRTVLGALGSKAVASGVTNPLTGNRFVGSLVNDVTLDSTFSITDLFSLVSQVSSENLARSPTYTFATYPVAGPDKSVDLGYDPAAARRVVLAFLGASVGAQGPSPLASTTGSSPGSGASDSSVAPPGLATGGATGASPGLATTGTTGTTIASVPGQAAQPTFFDPKTC